MGKIRLFGWIFVLLLFFKGSDAMPGMPVAEDLLCRYDVPQYAWAKQVQATPIFTKHTPQQEKIKIRYKGGESPDYLAVVPVIFRELVFADPVAFGYYHSFFFSQHHASSSLRGPPQA